MKSPLAKARDKWLLSEEGKKCCEGQTSGQYLQNRLEKAFLAGANFSIESAKPVGTQIICGLVDCLNRNENRLCGHTTIHLQPCSDAANVLDCSEFKE
jgi:hypothetical protein